MYTSFLPQLFYESLTDSLTDSLIHYLTHSVSDCLTHSATPFRHTCTHTHSHAPAKVTPKVPLMTPFSTDVTSLTVRLNGVESRSKISKAAGHTSTVIDRKWPSLIYRYAGMVVMNVY